MALDSPSRLRREKEKRARYVKRDVGRPGMSADDFGNGLSARSDIRYFHVSQKVAQVSFVIASYAHLHAKSRLFCPRSAQHWLPLSASSSPCTPEPDRHPFDAQLSLSCNFGNFRKQEGGDVWRAS